MGYYSSNSQTYNAGLITNMHASSPEQIAMDDSVCNGLSKPNRFYLLFSRYWILLFSAVFGIYDRNTFLVSGTDEEWLGKSRQSDLLYLFVFLPPTTTTIVLLLWRPINVLAESDPGYMAEHHKPTDTSPVHWQPGGWLEGGLHGLTAWYPCTPASLIFAWVWWFLRRKVKPVPLWGFILFLLPMAVDGTSHLLSDLSGLGQGFRAQNNWLVNLTMNRFPENFYLGDVLGSFNSWLRLTDWIPVWSWGCMVSFSSRSRCLFQYF